MNRLGSRREALATFTELFALSGLLIAQPVFDFLGKNARELIVLRLSLRFVLEFVVLALLVPPVLMWLAELAVSAAVPRLRDRVHAAVICVLLGVIAGNYVKVSTHLGAVPRIGAGLIVAALVAWGLRKTPALRQWLRFLAIAPLIFALLFVTASPASILLFQDAKAANVKIAHPARVIMIVFDEFPEESLLDGTGHIDAQLYPNFAQLAHDSTWYRNDTTVGEFTSRAVPAILTARYPTLNSALPIASKYPQSLFTLLGKTYTMHAHEFYEQLCPVSLCTEPTPKSPLANLVDAGSKVMHNLIDLNRASWDHNNGFRFGVDNPPGFQPSLTIGRNFVKSLRPSTKPTLDYLHVLLPHQPWQYLAGGKDHGINNPSLLYFLSTFPQDSRKVTLAREMHLLNVQATDWFLGQVMNRLKALGAYDNSLIVVTADHGVSFPYVRYTFPADYDRIMWTPLFVKSPGQAAGRIDDRPTRSIDVMPTMADILGVKIPWKVDGVSALGPRRAPGPVPIIRNDFGVPGRKQSFDGSTGFAKVLRARAAPRGGDPALRLYRIGAYGNLVGRAAAPLVRPSSLQLRGTLSTPGGWNHVDPGSGSVPWTAAAGTVTGIKTGVIAVAVNGRVAGLAVITANGLYYAMLAPQFFDSGKNDVRAYLVSGSPASPRLAAVPARAASPGSGQ